MADPSERKGSGSSKTKRDKSAEPVPLEERVGKLELAVADGEARLEAMEGRQHEWTELAEELEADIQSAVDVLKAQMAEVTSSMKAQIEEVKAKIVVLEKAVANSGFFQGRPLRLRSRSRSTTVELETPRNWKISCGKSSNTSRR